MRKFWLPGFMLVFGLSVWVYAAHSDKAAAEPRILPSRTNTAGEGVPGASASGLPSRTNTAGEGVPGASASGLPAGKKIQINERYAFQYEFPKKPRLGATVLKINVFDLTISKTDNKVTDLVILASSDMPSMRGHHATPPKPVQTNKNKDYLFPVDLVMRGKWEIVLSFQENGQEIYSGVILLKV